MTINFTDPMEAVEFSDAATPNEFYGTIRQSSDGRVTVEIHSNSLKSTKSWDKLDSDTITEMANHLENRISSEDLEQALNQAGFQLSK